MTTSSVPQSVPQRRKRQILGYVRWDSKKHQATYVPQVEDGKHGRHEVMDEAMFRQKAGADAERIMRTFPDTWITWGTAT